MVLNLVGVRVSGSESRFSVDVPLNLEDASLNLVGERVSGNDPLFSDVSLNLVGERVSGTDLSLSIDVSLNFAEERVSKSESMDAELLRQKSTY